MRFAVLLLSVVVVGCSEPECHDPDGDSFGAHCSAGLDCDDTNPTRNLDCEAVPPPDCEAFPDAPGCPCFAGTVVSCFLSDRSLVGVGACKTGVTTCTNGYYGLCNGYVGPGEETCNGRDDDCDGVVDEFVRSPCGGCDPECRGSVWGPDGTPFEIRPGLAGTAGGAVELARTETPRDGIFFANTDEDTVSHLSAASVSEVSRHASGGDGPSRVAVDYLGDVFVTNEALGMQGTITKIGGTIAGCVDRDSSGTIETSSGPGDVPALAADECVVFSVAVGGEDELPRAIAIDGSLPGGGDPWIGLARGEAVVHLDGDSGAELDRVAIPGFAPFSAAFDGRGYLWLASEDGELARIDRRAAPPSVSRTFVDLPCYLTHTIAVDTDGALIATGQNCDDVYRYDPDSSVATTLPTLENPRSLVIVGANAFVSHTDGRVSVVSTNPLAALRTFDAWALGATPLETVGIAVDPNGFVFAASARGGPGGVGVATRFDGTSGIVTHQIPLGIGPRSLGDGTGRSLRGSFATTGSTSATFSGCAPGNTTTWARLHVDLDEGASSSVAIDLRWATDEASLANATFAPIAAFPGSSSPIELTLPPDGVLELRLTLDSTARDSSPIVRRIGIEVTCVAIME